LRYRAYGISATSAARRARPNTKLSGKSDAQRLPGEVVLDHPDAAVDVTERADGDREARGFVLLGPAAVTGEHAEVDRALLQHPLVADIDGAVGEPSLADRRGGVGELHLAGVEVLVVERAGGDAAQAERSLVEPVAREALAAEHLEHVGVEVLVEQHRGRIAERRHHALRVVRVLVLAVESQ
jgi:hypothetical protein